MHRTSKSPQFHDAALSEHVEVDDRGVLIMSVVVDEVLDRNSRTDPTLPRTGGPAGNARLTAWTGAVLLVLFAVEGYTILDIRGLLSWHIAVGVLLIPPALLKVGSTGWRIVRYYTGDAQYRQAGPPQVLMRVIGPLVIVTTLSVLATGVLVAMAGPTGRHGSTFGLPVSMLFLHQATFIAWLVVMSVHVLGRTVRAAKIIGGREQSPARVPGSMTRSAALIAAAACSVVLAILLVMPWVDRWHAGGFRRH